MTDLTNSNNVFLYALAFTLIFFWRDWTEVYMYMMFPTGNENEWIPEDHLERHDGSHCWMDDE